MDHLFASEGKLLLKVAIRGDQAQAAAVGEKGFRQVAGQQIGIALVAEQGGTGETLTAQIFVQFSGAAETGSGGPWHLS